MEQQDLLVWFKIILILLGQVQQFVAMLILDQTNLYVPQVLF